MNYLLSVLFTLLVSCASNKEKDLIDLEYYIKQGKEISLYKKLDFKEIKKINKLQLSKPLNVNNWFNTKLNNSNFLPRFLINDFNNKISIDINAKSFLTISNNIYLVDKNSNLIVLNENLKELRRISIYKKKEFEDYPLDFSMTSDGKLIYISDNLGNIHGIEINTLKIKWFLKLGVPIKSNLYSKNDDLFFININSKLYSINSSNGHINWSHENASKISKEKYQIAIFNDLLITNNDFGEIYCYNLLEKKIFWKLSLNDQYYEYQQKNFKLAYPVISEGVLYLSSNFGETIAIQITTGKIIWRKAFFSTNLPIINNHYVFLINYEGFFYILNKKNGDVIYSADINKSFLKKNKTFYDLILAKNYIYFINSGENLIKLDINNLSSIKKDNQVFKNVKNYFVLNNHLYILQDKELSKVFN